MKHGDKAKAKSAKASSKNSGKKSSTKAGRQESSKGVKAGGAQPAKGQPAQPQRIAKSAGKATAPAPAKSGSSIRGNGGPPGSFSNAVIGAAFKRAVKKYPNAFRRLTD